jgi:hypothetical protein
LPRDWARLIQKLWWIGLEVVCDSRSATIERRGKLAVSPLFA